MDSPKRMRLKRQKERIQTFVVVSVLSVLTGLVIFGIIHVFELLAP